MSSIIIELIFLASYYPSVTSTTKPFSLAIIGLYNYLVVQTELGNIYRLNSSVYSINASTSLKESKDILAPNIMYTSLFNTLVPDSFFSPMRTVYVVSDSQLEEIKRKQQQQELEDLPKKGWKKPITLASKLLMRECISFKRSSKR